MLKVSLHRDGTCVTVMDHEMCNAITLDQNATRAWSVQFDQHGHQVMLVNRVMNLLDS